MPLERPYDWNVHTFHVETGLPVKKGAAQKKTRKKPPPKKTRKSTNAAAASPPVVERTPTPDTHQLAVPSPVDNYPTATQQHSAGQTPAFRVIALPPQSATTNEKEALLTLPPTGSSESPPPSSALPVTYTHIFEPMTRQYKQKQPIFMVLPVVPAPKSRVWPPASFEGETELRVLRETKPMFVDRRDFDMQRALRNFLLLGQFDLESPEARPGKHLWTFRSTDGSSLHGTWYRYLINDHGKMVKLFLRPVEVTRALVEQTDGRILDVSTITLPFKTERTITLEFSCPHTVPDADRAYRMWNGHFASTEVVRPLSTDLYYEKLSLPYFRSSVRLIVLKCDSPGSDEEEEEVEPLLYLFRLAVEDSSVCNSKKALKFTVWADVPVAPPPPPPPHDSGSGTTSTTSSCSVQQNDPTAGTDNANPKDSKIAFESKLIASGCSSADGIDIALNLDSELTELDEEQVEWEMGLVYYAMLAMKDKRFRIQ
ncbi:hypothetical protein H1R20_g11280, partial [Candolleomyces eurysporus]